MEPGLRAFASDHASEAPKFMRRLGFGNRQSEALDPKPQAPNLKDLKHLKNLKNLKT